MKSTNLSDRTDFEAATGSPCSLNFRGVNLSNSTAPLDTIFIKCDFSGADLSKTDLSGLTFRECLLQQTDFTDCILIGTKFTDKSDLTSAILHRVDAKKSVFSNSNLSKVEATDGEFNGADFFESKLEQSRFYRSDLTDVENFSPDRTYISEAVISGKTVDKWTVLRTEYTGLNLIISMFPAAIFVVSLLVKTYASIALSVSVR